MELLVAQQLVGGGVHGEHPEGRIAPAKGSDGRTQEYSAVDSALILHLIPTQTQTVSTSSRATVNLYR